MFRNLNATFNVQWRPGTFTAVPRFYNSIYWKSLNSVHKVVESFSCLTNRTVVPTLRHCEQPTGQDCKWRNTYRCVTSGVSVGRGRGGGRWLPGCTECASYKMQLWLHVMNVGVTRCKCNWVYRMWELQDVTVTGCTECGSYKMQLWLDVLNVGVKRCKCNWMYRMWELQDATVTGCTECGSYKMQLWLNVGVTICNRDWMYWMWELQDATETGCTECGSYNMQLWLDVLNVGVTRCNCDCLDVLNVGVTRCNCDWMY
jgi:ribosomal protein L32